MTVSRSRRPAADAAAPASKKARAAARVELLRRRAAELERRTQAERRRHASLDATLDAVDRDVETAGGILAGALAYRLFLWLLPFALVAVAGLGVYAHAASTTPEHAARSAGLAGIASGSIASAAGSPSRWYALVIGVVLLLLATRSLLRALIATHRLVWLDVRASAPRPTAAATSRFLVVVLGCFALGAVAAAVRARTTGYGILVSVVLLVPYAGLWQLVSLRLPHRGADARALLPGAILFGVGMELVNLASAYVLGPLALSKQGTYGALGVAAVLLTGLYLVSRVIVGAAVLNAVLWERRAAARPSGTGS
jgi:uncharacterized BrkB/YihY/UPF0761 family membrane protein